MPPVSVAVEVKNVEFTYKRNYLDILLNPRKRNKPILKGISLSVPKGKIYALLGASGCGKSIFVLSLFNHYLFSR